ncbi:MAG TPA: dihydrodipicolinate synthase family protein [Actinomycetota bacterium]|jgi:dihydrodipicolinate synthase/N-acetylneuraminate lyase
MLTGALAAAVTPLRDGGDSLDEAAFEPLVRFLADGGLDGILALGTTGEGVMLSLAERRRAVERFLDARPEGFAVAAHCGAQTTRDTAALAGHAAEAGADAVAVIAPPYYAFDPDEVREHFRSAASACSPLPFYIYEFSARSGYAVAPETVERLRDDAPNLSGLKVSDTPFDAVRPYLSLGLDVFIGSEPLVPEGLEHGAAGTVSGLATAFPEIVAGLVRGSPQSHLKVTLLRERLGAIPFQASMKAILGARGVPVGPDVRAPLRTLTDEERDVALEALRTVTAED